MRLVSILYRGKRMCQRHQHRILLHAWKSVPRESPNGATPLKSLRQFTFTVGLRVIDLGFSFGNTLFFLVWRLRVNGDSSTSPVSYREPTTTSQPMLRRQSSGMGQNDLRLAPKCPARSRPCDTCSPVCPFATRSRPQSRRKRWSTALGSNRSFCGDSMKSTLTCKNYTRDLVLLYPVYIPRTTSPLCCAAEMD
jgi:hypothetical protein